MIIIDANPNIKNADPIFKAIHDKNNEELSKLLHEYTDNDIIQAKIMTKREQYLDQKNNQCVQQPYYMNITMYALLRCNFEAFRIIAENDYNREARVGDNIGGSYFANSSLFRNVPPFEGCKNLTMVVKEMKDPKNKIINLKNIHEKLNDMLKCLIECGKYNTDVFPPKFTLDLCTDLLSSTNKIENVLKTVKNLPESEYTHRFLANYYFDEAEELKSIKSLEDDAVKKSLEYAIHLKNDDEKEIFVKRYLYGKDPSVQKMQQKLPKIVHHILTRGFEKEYILNALKNIKEEGENLKNIKEKGENLKNIKEEAESLKNIKEKGENLKNKEGLREERMEKTMPNVDKKWLKEPAEFKSEDFVFGKTTQEIYKPKHFISRKTKTDITRRNRHKKRL